MDETRAKINADWLLLALSSLKQLKIQNKYTLNKYKYNFTCEYTLSLHTLGDNMY